MPHIVQPGETITSRGLEIFPGGKGLNQSVALARAGALAAQAAACTVSRKGAASSIPMKAEIMEILD